MTSCPPVMEDNLLALAKGLSPIHTYKPYNGLFITYEPQSVKTSLNDEVIKFELIVQT